MYLSSLGEREKRLFLELLRHTALIDEEVVDSEAQALDSYIHECELPNYRPLGLPINKIIEELNNSSHIVKSIVMLELWCLLYSDKAIAEKEDTFMTELSSKWSFSDAQLRRYQRWAKDFINIIEDGNRLINE